MAPFKVLIIGGGVAGPSLAYWLSKLGESRVHVTLLERAPHIRVGGQQLDIRSHGTSAMRRMGIEEAVRAAVVREEGMQLVDVRGRVKAFFPPAPPGSKKQSFTSEFEIMRGDLVTILYGLTAGKENMVRRRFGEVVESWTQDPEDKPDGQVHVRFQGGKTEDFDLVVGADGTNSLTRKILLGPDAPDPRHRLGGYIGFFTVPTEPHDSKRATFCHLPGKVCRIIGTRKDRPDVTRVYMMAFGDLPGLDAAYRPGRSVSERKKAWADLFEDGGWECKRFMEVLRRDASAGNGNDGDDGDDDLYATPFQEVRLPPGSWSKGRVVLLGDAAHSGTANGLGTAWALVGAYILAGELGTKLLASQGAGSGLSTAEISQAARNYEDKWRPIATGSQGMTESGMGALFRQKSKLGIWLLHTMARLVSHLKLDPTEGIDEFAAKWVMPEYPALEGVAEG